MEKTPDLHRKDDLLTVISIAVVAFALANILHEAVGHGGACLLLGGKAQSLSSMHFDGDVGDPLGWRNKLVAAGGTLINLLAASVGYQALRRFSFRSWASRFFWWLFSMVNLLQATGYFLFSGLLNVGDWSTVVSGFPAVWLWRVLMTLLGGAAYYVAVLKGFQALAKWLSGDSQEIARRATKLALVSYFSGGILYLLAGFLNPIGIAIVFLSAVSASFGGASGLVWGPQLLRGSRPGEPVLSPIVIDRNIPWVAAAILVSLVFILLLGPGIQIG